MKTLLLATATCLALSALPAALPAQARISDNRIRIGVLNDRSGGVADLAGEGSAVAARMAVEEFGGTINGAVIEVVTADHQNKADIAANGRMFHDMHLVRVKKPSESTGPWDYFEIIKTIPAEQAFLDPAKSGCPLVK